MVRLAPRCEAAGAVCAEMEAPKVSACGLWEMTAGASLRLLLLFCCVGLLVAAGDQMCASAGRPDLS
ncbi:hypothetical protein chiPu_0001047 [Chiloscyllium punctatum]|uniref:Uncharacterized protein n=1 Tax=Chiloscyllium punctatum TaxID=137246 RepID=A0A401RX32_CHIPU|nr:hypothetical protein [Chiloscyllium punctatum]